jgi:hypothetical protein
MNPEVCPECDGYSHERIIVGKEIEYVDCEYCDGSGWFYRTGIEALLEYE